MRRLLIAFIQGFVDTENEVDWAREIEERFLAHILNWRIGCLGQRSPVIKEPSLILWDSPAFSVDRAIETRLIVAADLAKGGSVGALG